MGGGFSKMKKQAKMMQEQMMKMQSELKNKTFEGTAANGLVTITMNGEKEITKIKINPSCVDPKDVEGLQDLIVVACSDAYKKILVEEEKNPMSLNNLMDF